MTERKMLVAISVLEVGFVLSSLAVVLVLPTIALAQQQAGIVELDCSKATIMYNVWIDTEKSFATVRGEENYTDGSYPAQITPTSITWTLAYYGYTMEVTIDRTAGTIRWHTLPNNTGGGLDRTDSCTRGSTPFPATKF